MSRDQPDFAANSDHVSTAGVPRAPSPREAGSLKTDADESEKTLKRSRSSSPLSTSMPSLRPKAEDEAVLADGGGHGDEPGPSKKAKREDSLVRLAADDVVDDGVEEKPAGSNVSEPLEFLVVCKVQARTQELAGERRALRPRRKRGYRWRAEDGCR